MAGSQLQDRLRAVCGALEAHSVEYMLVGGTAVALNGYYRRSIDSKGNLAEKPDIDVWYNPSYANYFNVLKALKDLGYDVSALEQEQSPNPRSAFIKLEFEDFTFDLLPKIKAKIGFYEANQRKESVEIVDVPIHFMCVEDLIADKKATGRGKDLEDIRRLKDLRGL